MPRPPGLRSAGLGEPVHVLVGLIVDERARVLVSQRRAGTHLAGSWEFPGGKLEPGEEPLTALRRELAEELGIEVGEARPFLELVHDYPDRRVRLDFWWVDSYSGLPQPLEGQAVRWVPAAELGAAELLPADRPAIEAIEARLATGRQ